MVLYHAVMLGEDGMEFPAEVQASSHEEAEELISENYPESSIITLESPTDRQSREYDLYAESLEDDGWED